MRALFASIAVLSVLASASSVAAGIVEPGGTPEATRLAITNPDEYAWQLFFFLNHQARPGVAGLADDSKPFGKVDANASVVWETWALASGGSASEVYKPNGGRPDDWDKLNRNGRVLILDRNLEREVVLQDAKSLKPFFFPPSPLDQEVRQNRGTFEFVVSKEMYNRDGLEGLRDAAVTAHDRQLISFPATAKEIKAQWLAIKDTDKPRYFWREIQKPDGTKTVFGLVSLHIITKDLPNWFWADFGHIDCETKKGACDTQDQEEAKTNPIDSTTRGPKAPSERKLTKDDGVPEIVLEQTPDILAGLVTARRPGQRFVGFAAETEDAVARGRRKLERKGVDLLVVNDVAAPGVGFDHDTNAVTILDAAGHATDVPLTSKDEVADVILDRVVGLLAPPTDRRKTT